MDSLVRTHQQRGAAGEECSWRTRRRVREDPREGPAVFEYSDTQVDAHGNYVSVMKRGYAFVANGQLNTWVGYKVGDLQRVYIGRCRPSRRSWASSRERRRCRARI